MDVEFAADGFDPIVVGVRLPSVDENIDAVIHSFAPHSIWNVQTVNYAEVEVGRTGCYIAPTQKEIEQELANAKMWGQIDFEKQVGDVLVKFGLLTINPTKIPVAEL